MTSLHAKLKGKPSEHRIIFSDSDMPDNVDILPTPDVSDATEYAPLDLTPDPRSWYYVELDMDQIDEMIEPYLLTNHPEMLPLAQPEYDVVDTLYSVNGQQIVFKRVAGAMRIHEHGKRYIVLGTEETSIQTISFALEFSGEADAYYDGGSKRVYFQQFAKAKPMFRGFDVFHQESTMEEKEAFLDNPLFDVGDFNLNYISLNDVRRIAAFRENIAIDLDSSDTQQRVRQYIHNFPSAGLSIGNDGRIMIGSRKELSAMLKLLEQKYYIAEIT